MALMAWLNEIRASAKRSSVIASCVGLTILGMMTVPAWADDFSRGDSFYAQKTVAAGFGYQDAESSTITVKTYDAVTGDVLTDETYELDIKDDDSLSGQPRARVFAGGVGIGADGLSEFTLRVYDADNGSFLWEGRLNLIGGSNPEVDTYPIVAHVRPRLMVSKVVSRMYAGGQPYFVLRAMNPETGQVMWSDEFSADAAQARVETIGRSIIGMRAADPRDIDFRIKMLDAGGRQLLWEDRVLADIDDETTALERSEDDGALPPRGESQAQGGSET
ncbi:hypothetical protein [Petrachloros mirabilis]